MSERVLVLPFRIRQTVVVVTATSGQLIAENLDRRYLAWMVNGTADVTITAGSVAAVAGAGMVYQSNGSGAQGGSETFANGAPTNAFQCIAASTGSSVYVWEGF